ncbi:MAG TPA: tripartite tricarboxylate transporter TctB family protein [Methylomirabilota bacterium]|nr:tripartite tricarboxylate transporter TctB family protein [Methylomirabilota bacterium]
MTTDRVAGAALAALALAVLAASRALPLGSLRHPGPGYMPVVLALVLAALAVAVLASGGRAPRLGAVGWAEWRHALAIAAACAFAAWALERLGYRLTVGVVVAVLVGAVERRGPVTALVVAAGLAAGSFFLFSTLLRVPLPRGPFGL